MIRNVIFDLGNVLLSWKPGEYLENNGYDPATIERIMVEIFRSPEWLALDNGDLSLHDAIERIQKKSSFKTDEIYAVFNLRTKILAPIGPNTKIIPELKKEGYRLFYLSNFPADIFDEVRSNHAFFGFFDGGLISANARASKPDPKIFNLLFEKYSIDPSESLFIDDTHVNAVSAETLGVSVIHLSDPLTLVEKLEEILGLRFLS